MILSHADEAALTLLGVTGGDPAEESIVVMDVGGGSSEVILVGPGADPVVGAFAVGSSRLTAAVVEHDPPTPAEIAELQARARMLVRDTARRQAIAGHRLGWVGHQRLPVAGSGAIHARGP